VNDTSGAVIQGATATITNAGTGERRTATTAADGAYRFVNLVPGTYRVEFEQKGFKRYTRDQVQVNVEAAVRVDVNMEVGEVTQSVEVTAEAALLQTENASLSQVMASRSVQELPLNGRNVLNLVQLVPGVVPQGSSDGNLTGKNVFAAGNYAIGGGTANQSASYFDGVPVNCTYGNIVALVPSQDAVAEFRVQTNNLSAEYGRYTGGVVNMASKSGSNEFHGSAYEFFRNKVLNASDFFANKTGAGKPPFAQNQFGVNIGGPIRKDKTFFFFAYEGYRQRQGVNFLYTVPTAAMRTGDFSDLRTAAGALVPIYDPLTQCGQLDNPACVAGAAQRQPFADNRIPVSRINPVARKFVDFPAWALPNIAGSAYTRQFNFTTNAATGGDNDQYNIRGDQTLSDKQRLIMRYTRWHSQNLQVPIYGNGLFAGDPYSPEIFTTTQALLADTYSINPTTIFDIRLGFLRWDYNRLPGTLGIDIPKTFGLPSYFGQIEALDGVSPVTTMPTVGASGYNFVSTGRLVGATNTYTIVPSLIKIVGRHTFKFGGELRRMDINYYQNNSTGGSFSYDNIFTAASSAGGSSGNSIASLLLGYPSAGTMQISPFTAASIRYQGYYFNDSFAVSSKLTVNYGLRWEIPGVYTERYDRIVDFDPKLVNPVTAGVTINGKPVLGGYVLVKTPNNPQRGLRPEHWTLFAPRLGIAYRLSDRTVLRTGAGLFYIPSDIQFPEGPYGNVANRVDNVLVASTNNNQTPAVSLSDPYPGGFKASCGRCDAFQKVLLGANNRAVLRSVRYGYTGQWNLTLQHQFQHDVAVEAAYAGLRGMHLPQGAYQYNFLPSSAIALGSQLATSVANPLYGIVGGGVMSRATVPLGNLLLPFPQYSGNPDPGGYVGNSVYHAFQAKAEKRFSGGSMLLASYTFSKSISDIETLTTWLDAGTGVAGVQDWNNFRAERSLSSFDSRQRLTVSYVLDLPMGKGKKLLSNVSGPADKLVSGWGINGMTTLQMGFPLGLTASPNQLSGWNLGLRPNVVAGCNPVKTGPAQARLTQWFNTACYSVPASYTFGSASRTDPVLRGHGTNNFDFAVFKRTTIGERVRLEFRTEFFNVFNRVRFASPGLTASTASTSTFGQVNNQANSPRLIQLALRLSY